MSEQVESSFKTFDAGENLEPWRRVKLSSSSGTQVEYSDAGEDYIGVTQHQADSGEQVTVRMANPEGTLKVAAGAAVSVGATVYGAADGKVSSTASGAPQGIALDAASGDGSVIEVSPAIGFALEELYQNAQSTQRFEALPLGAFREADGTALADFAGGDSTTPGWANESEVGGIRWNNHANPDPISASFPYPPDLDASADVTVHLLAAKVGATLADAVTWTVQFFENLDGALYDADADAGGASSAMTGDATSKTVQEETLTIAAADVNGAPGAFTISIQPTDGTLDTDDVILIAVWLEYTGQVLQS